MRLWHLKRVASFADIKWDSNVEMIVRATNEAKARELAAKKGGSFEEGVWTDPTVTTCEKLAQAGKAGIVIVNSKDG